MSREKDCLVSLIVPLFNDSSVIASFVKDAHQELSSRYENFEIVLVDDGSTDSTSRVVESILSSLDCIRFLRLSRHFGLEIAISAGFETAIGDYTIVMLPEFDPVNSISEIVQTLRSSRGLVIGRSKEPLYGSFHRIVQRLFSKACSRFFDIQVHEDTTYLLALNRNTLNSLNKIRDRFKHIKTFSDYVGSSPTFFDYTLVSRSGRRWGRSLYEAINLAIDIVVSNSVRPLRYISLLGLTVSGINLAYFGYIGLIAFFKKNVAEGWTTLSTQSALSFFVLNLVLSVICEYLGRILVESKDRPAYFIVEERNSSVLIAEKDRRLNIVTTSTSNVA